MKNNLIFREYIKEGFPTFRLQEQPTSLPLVSTPLEKLTGTYFGLAEKLHSLKRHTARAANKVLQKSGAFWQDESYDHFIRDEAELDRVVKYVLHNPSKPM